MKILAIRGRNIASLEGNFEIDFTKEPLNSNGIFAITGHTGAGKSTLLDALCIALYEQAPRLSQSNSRDIADVGSFSISSTSPLIFLRRGATEGFSEVDFVGVDGDTYRSRWSVWRANRRIDRKIQPAVMSLSNLTKNTEIDGKKTELLLRISSLVGLSYEQFTRSVLLAQGEFASFLKANDNARATLLEKLTGTEIYSIISKLIFERTKDALSEYENVKLRMSEHHLLSLDELEQKKQLKDGLTDKDSELTAHYNKLVEQQRWYGRFDSIQNQIQQTKVQIEETEKTIRTQANIRKQMEDLNTLSMGIQCCKDLKRLASEKNQLDERKKELLAQKEKSEKQLSNKKGEYNSLKDDYDCFVSQEESLFDELKRAREIDVHYANKQQSLRESLHQLNEKKLKVEEKKHSIDNINSEINSANKSFNEAEDWLNHNSCRKEVAGNFHVICQHLNSAMKIKKDIAANDGQLAQKLGEIATLQNESNKQKEQIPQLQGQLAKKQKELSDLKSAISGIDNNQLIADKSLYQEKQNNLANLLSCVQKILPKKKEIQDNAYQLKMYQSQLSLSNINRENCKKEEPNLKGKAEQALSIYQQLQLAVSENVERLRAALKEGEACPVCGSTYHPFAQSLNEIFQKELRLAEKEKDDRENDYRAIQKKIQKLDSDIENLDSNLNGLKSKIENSENELTEYIQAWFSLPLSDQFDIENDTEIEQILSKVKVKVDNDIKLIDNMINLYATSVSKSGKLTEEIHKIEQKLDEISASLNGLNSRIGLLCEFVLSIRSKNSEYNEDLNIELEAVDAYFSNSLWRNNWMNDSQEFIDKMKIFVEKWKNMTTQRDNSFNRKNEQKSILKNEQLTFDSLNNDYKQAEDYHLKLSQELTDLYKRRQLLFQGKNADEVESEYNKEKGKKNNSLDSIKKDIDSLAKTSASFLGQFSELSKQIKQLLDNQKQKNDELDSFISDYNDGINDSSLNADTSTYSDIQSQDGTVLSPREILTVTYMEELATLSTDYIDQHTQQIKSANNQKIQLDSELNTHNKNLTHLLNSRPLDLSAEETSLQLAQVKGDIQDIESKLVIIKTELKQHDDNERHLVKLQEDLVEKEGKYRNWNTLNTLVGSSSGDKFKQIAQGYTLDLLLQTANMNICTIAPRYRLQRVPDSLSLQVIDKDMCDQIRAVNTLSGGETFLVSLSLALGLSALSSSRMNIESLFIDEGFGSLDEDSLCTAMQALDTLRLQGRKVGVITHVKEVTERIATQIQVIKGHNGASYIRIV